MTAKTFIPFALIMPVSIETVSVTDRWLSLVTISPVLASVTVDAPLSWLFRGVSPDEVGDHGAEPFAGVLLQEVPGTGNHRMDDSRRPRHGLLQHRRHRAGDRIAVAERHQERLVPGGQ